MSMWELNNWIEVEKMSKEIDKLKKENEIMKKVIVMFISNLNQNGELKNFDLENKKVLEKLLGQLIL